MRHRFAPTKWLANFVAVVRNWFTVKQQVKDTSEPETMPERVTRLLDMRNWPKANRRNKNRTRRRNKTNIAYQSKLRNRYGLN